MYQPPQQPYPYPTQQQQQQQPPQPPPPPPSQQQQSSQQPQQQPQQQQQPAGTAPQQAGNQSHQPPYQAPYPYPPQQVVQPGYNPYPPPSYPYPPPPQGSYYYPPQGGYPPTYPGQPPPTYQTPYPRPPYPIAQYPSAQYPPYNSQHYYHNGNGYQHPHPQQYQKHLTPGHTKSNSPPSTKRQRIEPRPPQQNGNNHKHHPRTQNKEKKTFSDFRVSRIKIGNFTSDEARVDGDVRDSRLRFYFRSVNSHPSPRLSLTAANIAAQCPDRLSVSLHKGTRRIIVPATNLSSVTINRIEGYVKVEGDGWAAFEEIRDDVDEAGSTTSKASGGGHKFVPTNVDPTEGEWATHKTMEIWLNRNEALTEPKWARGNLRENIDPSSLFHNIIHIVNVEQHVMPFDEMLEDWRERSLAGNLEVRSNFITSFHSTDKLVQLMERTVQITSPQLTTTIEALLNLIQNKETLHDHFEHILFGMPHLELWRAVDSMLLEDLGLQREESRSGLSSVSVNLPTKREREDDHDEDMEMVSNDREGSHQATDMSVQDHPNHKDANVGAVHDKEMTDQEKEGNQLEKDNHDKDVTLPDQSDTVSVVNHTELLEAPDTVAAEETTIDEGQLDEGDIVVHRVGEDLGMDFTIPDDVAFTPAVTQ